MFVMSLVVYICNNLLCEVLDKSGLATERTAECKIPAIPFHNVYVLTCSIWFVPSAGCGVILSELITKAMFLFLV